MFKNHVKTILFTLVMLLLVAAFISSVFGLVILKNNAFDITSENLDDSYGKLDTNTKLILENTLEKFAKKENIPIYFSFVFEDLNENYIRKFGKTDGSVFICYNDTTKELNVISNLLENDSSFKKILTSKDDLSKTIPDFVNTISDNVRPSKKTFYFNNLEAISGLILSVALVTFIILSALVERYLKHLKRYFLTLKSHKNNKNKKMAAESEADDEIIEIPLDQI